MAEHAAVEACVIRHCPCFKWVVYLWGKKPLSGFKAVVTWIHCLHDRIALHELARLHHKFGNGLRRCGMCVSSAQIHVQEGSQTYADDQRTEYQFAIIADQERLLDESELRPHGKHLSTMFQFLHITESLTATSGKTHE